MEPYLSLFFMLYFSEVEGSELADSSSMNLKEDGPSSVTLVKKEFAGRYAITSEEFTSEMVRLQNQNFLFIYLFILC